MSRLQATPPSRYDVSRSYQWNYDHPPLDDPGFHIPPMLGTWNLCGLPINSPLGVPAGPLLNGDWCAYYARLGFDVLTYKTVRSRQHPCYSLPNLLPVACSSIDEASDEVPAQDAMSGSWAVSFGMPSAVPEVWERDVARARSLLGSGQILSVSVVGTIQPNWTMNDLANDYAWCANRAVMAGADIVETNFSCPNVSTCDGQLYQLAADAGLVARVTREAIGTTPFMAKIGHLPDQAAAERLVDAIGPFIDGLAMTNSIAAKVRRTDGSLEFDGNLRGICGAATFAASLRQVKMMRDVIERSGHRLEIVGVGGAGSASDVRQYLDAGAANVHIATAAMIDPLVGIKIRESF
jgi:dihydroorotate dehydrogenase (NAD+) catalytic subunit